MADYELVIRARRAVTPGGIRPAAVAIRDGKIVALAAFSDAPDGARVEELPGEQILLPGVVDTHVHVNEPGRTEWEGFATATRAAAEGGVTTLIDMPLNCLPPTTTASALRRKQPTARGGWVDVGFWGGAVPGNLEELAGLHRAGVFGFKAFLVDSGVPEFGYLDSAGLDAALAEVARLDALLIVHAEDAAVIAAAPSPAGRSYAGFLASRPPAAEDTAIARLLAAAGRHGARVHVLHLASASALPVIAAARADGVRVSAETCPHYLTFCAEEIPDGATEYKCCPPIRGSAHRDGLWGGLADGLIDAVVSDHSPCPPSLKQQASGDFAAAWGGISSLQLGLPAVWTQARQRGHSLADVARWMAAGPATLAGVPGKGAIAPGHDADLVAFDDVATFTVDPARLRHRHPVTPYAGRTLTGVVRRTWLRGQVATAAPAGCWPASMLNLVLRDGDTPVVAMRPGRTPLDVTQEPLKVQLEMFLDEHRAALHACLDGLTEEQARRSLVPSRTTLLGLVKHATYAEKVWFGEAVTGRPRQEMGLPPTAAEAFILTDEDTIESIRRAHAQACEASRRATAGLGLDDVLRGHYLGPLPLRWVYLHTLREFAQHCGHADILREQILSAG